MARFIDPAGDDHGPGGYQYPSDTILFPRGTFDLRELTVTTEGDDVLFTVTLGHKIQRPPVVKRTNATEIPLDNGIYVQNIDIYLDTDPTPGVGFTEAIPGRNVTIQPQDAWDVAVVLTPQPYAARSALTDWAPARKVIFARPLQTIGNRVTARVSILELPEPPQPHWGYQAVVTGALWEASFDVINRYVLDQQLNAFTMRVQTVAEDRAFGGGELHLIHPFVIDMLAPPAQRQEAYLADYDGERRKLAAIPLVYPNPEAHRAARLARAPLAPRRIAPAPEGPAALVLDVRDVQGNLVILACPNRAPAEFKIGIVLGPDGREVGKVVVTSVHPGFVTTTAVAGAEAIVPGLRVRFAASNHQQEVKK